MRHHLLARQAGHMSKKMSQNSGPAPLIPESVRLLGHEWSQLCQEEVFEVGMLAISKQLPYILIIKIFNRKLFQLKER